MEQVPAEAGEKKFRKVVFVVSILTCSVISLCAFVGLGIVLREFFVFDAGRTQAYREVDRLQQTAKVQEQDNLAFGEALAQREALLDSRQQYLETYITLTSQVAIAWHDLQSALNVLKETRDVLSVEQGMLTAIKKENIALTERRVELAGDLSAKKQEMAESETMLAKLKKQIATLRLDREATQAAFEAMIKHYAIDAERLTNLIVRVETTRKVYQETERDVENAKSSLAALNLKAQVQEAKLATLTAEIGDAERRAEKLKNDLDALARDKHAAQASADATKALVTDATMLHTNLLIKINAQRGALVQVEKERDEACAERDIVTAQAALAKETTKNKEFEKTVLEADITDLMKRLKALTIEQADFEKRKLGLEAEIAILAKRKAEAAKEVTP